MPRREDVRQSASQQTGTSSPPMQSRPALKEFTPSDINVANKSSSAHKAAALEAEILRLQRDVEQHRTAEASLQAAVHAAVEAWNQESIVADSSSSDEEERREDARLLAALAENARLQEELERAIKLRMENVRLQAELEREVTFREEAENAREAVEQDAVARCESFERERERLTAKLSAAEAELNSRQPEDVEMACALTQTEDDELLVNELSSARLEATTARARVEEALSALAVAKEAEQLAKHSESMSQDPPVESISPSEAMATLEAQLAEESHRRQEAESKVQHLVDEIAEMRVSQEAPHRSDSLSNSQELNPGEGLPDAQFTKQLSDALEAKEMADAQASMLRSCLEDTEELLEESRASVNHLETKIASMEAAKPQEDGELELLRVRAEGAEKKLVSALQQVTQAESEARLLEVESHTVRTALTELEDEVSGLRTRLLEAEGTGCVQVHLHVSEAHDDEVAKEDFRLKEAEHNVVRLVGELNAVKDEANRARDIMIAERDGAVRALQDSLEEALSRATSAETELMLVRDELKKPSGDLDLRSQVADLHAQLEERHRVVQLQIHVMGDSDAAVKTLEKRSKDAEGMVVEANRALAEVKAVVAALEIDLKETKEKAAAAESRAKLAEAEVENVRIAVEGERDMVVATLEARLKEAEDASQHARLQVPREGKAQNEASVAKEHTDAATNATAAITVAEALAESATAQSAAKEALDQASRASAQAKIAEDRAERVAKDLANATAKRREAEEAADDLQRELERTRAESSNALRSLEQLRSDFDAFERTAKERASELGKLRASSSVQALRIEDLLVKLNAAESVTEEAGMQRSKIAELTAKLQSAEQALVKMHAEKSSVDQASSQLESRLQSDQLRFSSLRAEVDALTTVLADVKAQNEVLQRQNLATANLGTAIAVTDVSVQTQSSDADPKLVETKRSLDAAHDRVAELEAKSTSDERLMAELKSKCMDAELSAQEMQSAFTTFKAEADQTLQIKSGEVIAAEQAVSRSEAARREAEARIVQLKHFKDEALASSARVSELNAEVTELRAALAEAVDAHAGQQQTQNELKQLLEAAEAASAKREAEYAARCASLEAKAFAEDQRSQTSLAETAKLEWSISVLGSRLQAEEARVASKQDEIERLTSKVSDLEASISAAASDGKSKLTAREVEMMNAQREIATTRRDLEDTRHEVKRLEEELAGAERMYGDAMAAAASLATEVESKITAAEQRAVEAESALATFREEANQTLEAKTTELLATTRALSEAEASLKSSEGTISTLRQSLSDRESKASLDAALEAEVVELRAALAEAVDAQSSQQSSLTELTMRLEAAEGASKEQDAQLVGERDQMAAKLAEMEESLSKSRAEYSKAEWCISDLQSRLKVEEVKLADAITHRATCSAAQAEAEKTLNITRMHLDDAVRKADHSETELESARRQLGKRAEVVKQLETRCATAEQRALNAESALVEFKREMMLTLQTKASQVSSAATSELEAELAEFKRAATASLEVKTAEIMLATHAASQASAARASTLNDIENMKRAMTRLEEKASLDAEARVSAVTRAAKAEVARLNELLANSVGAAEKAHYLEEEVSKLRSELARATQSHVLQTTLHDELRSKLDSLQRLYEEHQRDTKDELAKLHSELDSRERSVNEADHRAAEANSALSSYKHKMELELTELSNRASEASDRAAQFLSAKESADLEVARLEMLCADLRQSQERTLAETVQAETNSLATVLRELQYEHADTLDTCASLREQLELVAAAAENATRWNERRIREAEDATCAAEARVQEMLGQVAELRAEAAASAENTASISAIRASLEEELAAKDGVIRSANEARERALDETREMQRKLSEVKGRVIELEAEKDAAISDVSRLSEALDNAGDTNALSSVLRAELISSKSEVAKLKQKVSTLEVALDSSEGDFSQIIRATADRELALQTRAEKAEQRGRMLQTQLTQLQSGASQLSSSKAEIKRLTDELKTAKKTAADATKLAERLKIAERQHRVEIEARKSVEAKMSDLEVRLDAEKQSGIEEAKRALREETEVLMLSAQKEVEKSLLEVQQVERQLAVSQARVTQLEREVIRLQKHEHALHELLGAAE